MLQFPKQGAYLLDWRNIGIEIYNFYLLIAFINQHAQNQNWLFTSYLNFSLLFHVTNLYRED
jgi:hypothetical protein